MADDETHRRDDPDEVAHTIEDAVTLTDLGTVVPASCSRRRAPSC